jgi:predicted metal-dependent hydrolase
MLDGTHVSYRVRVSARARRISLRITPAAGLEVVLPRGASVARAEVFLREKSAWVLRTLERMRQSTPPKATQPLRSGRVLSFAGEPLTLRIQTGAPAGRFRAVRDGSILTLTVSDADEARVRAALVAWYRRQAPGIFAERLERCNRLGLPYGRVTIKEQKSRWGSCSHAGNLNFNWRLLLAPLPVLDYVVVHELCHLREANHGQRFWALVASLCPEYQQHRRWLRQHGHDLTF